MAIKDLASFPSDPSESETESKVSRFLAGLAAFYPQVGPVVMQLSTLDDVEERYNGRLVELFFKTDMVDVSVLEDAGVSLRQEFYGVTLFVPKDVFNNCVALGDLSVSHLPSPNDEVTPGVRRCVSAAL